MKMEQTFGSLAPLDDSGTDFCELCLSLDNGTDFWRLSIPVVTWVMAKVGPHEGRGFINVT